MHHHALRERAAMNEFTLEEAVALIYRTVVLGQDTGKRRTLPDITCIGVICGVLAMNDQIEVVVKFHDTLRQFTKEEFVTTVTILEP